MIGVSTGQNITNVIPAVQKELAITDFLVIETSKAKTQNWFKGSEEVLNARKIEVTNLDISSNDSHIVEIKNQLKTELKTYNSPIIWNLGGGQKPQQIPAWELFYERNKRGIKDQVCYTNQVNASLIEVWYFNENAQLESKFLNIEVDLSATEIFQIFGYRILENPALIYSKGKQVSFTRTKDLFNFQDFRHFLFELSNNFEYLKNSQDPFSLEDISNTMKVKMNEIENSIASRLAKESVKYFNEPNQRNLLATALRGFLFGNKNKRGKLLEWLETPVEPKKLDISENLRVELGLNSNQIEVIANNLNKFTNYSKLSYYFEQIVSQRVRDFLQNNANSIIEAYSNLKIAKLENEGISVAEYDVLCVTNKGTIIVLDAKTFEFAQKDQDARLYNLQEASGIFMNFSVVLPLDYEDIDTGFVPPKLIDLAFNLKKRRAGFFVVSDSTPNSSYWLKKNANGVEKSKSKPIDLENWIELRPLQNVF